jgi:hypothetical protein
LGFGIQGNKLHVHAGQFTLNWDGITEKPNMFKREFSVAVDGLIYKDGRGVDFVRGIKSAMRKIDAKLRRERE